MLDLLINNTPIESYKVNGRTVWVKREDLCSPFQAPPFSKVRGLVPALIRLKSCGIGTVGYTETSISMAGWGVAWACQQLEMKAVIFDPQYKETPAILKHHRKQWSKFNPDVIPIKAGMAKVNFYISQKILLENYPHSEMLPLGLVLPETIKATREEIKCQISVNQMDFRTIVVNVGSGTICSALVAEFKDQTVIGVMGRTGNIEMKRNAILQKAGVTIGGLFKQDFQLIDPGWQYTESCPIKSPFPTHPYYDAKAWKWLVDNLDLLKEPILFWNIGRMK